MTKKICLLGATGVGKTSLVARFVRSMFSEKYQTTIGVKVDKKEIELDGEGIRLMIWDLEGGDETVDISMKYTRSADGCLLVADGTRNHTIDTLLSIHQRVLDQNGPVPCISLLNKHDLVDDWVINEGDTEELDKRNIPWLNTSAKADENVDQAFRRLAQLKLPQT
ncbi:MAG: Rab family GTPase [Limisphaerales bacterium]